VATNKQMGASNFLLTIHEENLLPTMESSNIQTFFHIRESSQFFRTGILKTESRMF